MSTNPPSGADEYLEPDGGSPVGRQPRRPGRRRGIAVGVGAAAAAGILGGGVWAATAFLQAGDQPAQALPAGTLGYVSVDLDPSGSQKVAAIRTLNKFPAFEQAADLDSEDDVVARLVGLAVEQADCDLSYESDVEPWLGSRFALAAVEAGESGPSPILVAQVTDAAAAEEGLAAAVAECGGGGDGAAWSVADDWLVVAETQDVLDQVVRDAAAASLADDADFERWTGEAGDPGIVTGYAAPGAGAYLAEELARTTDGAAGDAFAKSTSTEALDDSAAPGAVDPLSEGRAVSGTAEVPDAMVEALEGFEGAAMTVRFGDGSLEVETAADTSGFGLAALGGSTQGAAAVSQLPEDTLAALGVGFEEGWAQELIDYLRSQLGEQQAAQVDQAIAQAEQQTGLSIPADLETLLGESTSISIGGGITLEGLTASQDGSDLPVGVRIEGDADQIEAVLEKIRTQAGPGAGLLLASESDEDTVTVSPSSTYRGSIGEDGGLGDSEKFTGVVAEADRASSVLYVDIDAAERLLSEALASSGADGSGEIGRNVEPLSALGLSSWTEDEVSHSRLTVTTDD